MYVSSTVAAEDFHGLLALWSIFVPTAGPGYAGGESAEDFLTFASQFSVLLRAMGYSGLGLDYSRLIVKGTTNQKVTRDYIIRRRKAGEPLKLTYPENVSSNYMNHLSTVDFSFFRPGSTKSLSEEELQRAHGKLHCAPKDDSLRRWAPRWQAKREGGRKKGRVVCKPLTSLPPQVLFSHNNPNLDYEGIAEAYNQGGAFAKPWAAALDTKTGFPVGNMLKQRAYARKQEGLKNVKDKWGKIQQAAQAYQQAVGARPIGNEDSYEDFRAGQGLWDMGLSNARPTLGNYSLKNGGGAVAEQ